MIIGLVAAHFILSGFASAGEVSLEVAAEGRSRYVMDNGAVIQEDPVAQLDLLLALPRGFRADLSGSTDFQGQKEGVQGIEVGVGWTDRTFVDVGVFYLDFSGELAKEEFGDVIRPHIELFKRFEVMSSHTLTPFLRFEYLFATEGGRDNSGLFLSGGLRHSWMITERVGLQQGWRFLYDDGVFGSDRGVVGGYDLALSIQVAERVIVKPIIFELLTSVASVHDRRTDPVVGGAVVLSFH